MLPSDLLHRLQCWLDVSSFSPTFGRMSEPRTTNGAPPWGSKARINRAGDALRSAEVSREDADCLDAWRAGHRYVLNTFQAILRNKTRGQPIEVAQRLKRRITIIDKLSREPHMQLARMDDVAGCRLIFPSLASLEEFRAKFHKSRFQHKRRNDLDKYDYIQHPKPLGYRGIHDVYEYDANSIKGRQYKGLLIELQYRTRCQHAWATSVELMSHLTGYEPKFNASDAKHVEFFRLASEVIARTCEDSTSCYPDLSDIEVARKLERLDSEIHLMTMLRRMRPSQETAGDASTLILQIGESGGLRIHEFPNPAIATGAYFRLEKDYPKDDIVLVTADTFDEIRTAYRNYFSDVSDFVRHVDDGCDALLSQT